MTSFLPWEEVVQSCLLRELLTTDINRFIRGVQLSDAILIGKICQKVFLYPLHFGAELVDHSLYVVPRQNSRLPTRRRYSIAKGKCTRIHPLGTLSRRLSALLSA